MKFNKNQALGFTSKLSDFEIVNQEFIRCKCYMLATGDNVNGSDITLESVQKAMARGEFYNKPVVAHLYRDPEDNNKWRVGGHDSKWIITNTSFDIVNECIPFGVIPESSNLQLEEVLEADGETINTYLTCQIILWVGRYNIMDAAYSDDIYFNQSCELSINEYHWKDNDVLAIDDFTFSALCLLNKSDDKSKNVRPCFPSCRVEKMKAFSIDESKFKQNFELMLEKLKQYESDGIPASVQNNVTNNNPQMEGENKMDFAKITEVLSESNDNCKYKFLNATENKVFALDLADYKPYGFDCAFTKTEDTESIVIDFESKTEMSLSATDKIADENFDEFSIKNEIDTVKEDYAKSLITESTKKISESLSKEFKQGYDKLKESYDTLSESYKLAADKLAVFEKKEAELKEKGHKEGIDNLVKAYAEKLGKYSKFLVYKAQIEEHYSKSVDEVRQDLIFMAGNYLTSQENSLKRNFSYTPTEAGVNGKRNETTNNKYGHLLDKYIK